MDDSLLSHLRDDAEVEISTTKADGDAVTTTIWSVAVGDTAYVRSVNGADGMWWKRATARNGNGFEIDGTVHPVRFVAVEDDAELSRVDDAYEAKYRSRWSSSTDAINAPAARPYTLRVDA